MIYFSYLSLIFGKLISTSISILTSSFNYFTELWNHILSNPTSPEGCLSISGHLFVVVPFFFWEKVFLQFNKYYLESEFGCSVSIGLRWFLGEVFLLNGSFWPFLEACYSIMVTLLLFWDDRGEIRSSKHVLHLSDALIMHYICIIIIYTCVISSYCLQKQDLGLSTLSISPQPALHTGGTKDIRILCSSRPLQPWPTSFDFSFSESVCRCHFGSSHCQNIN